MRASPVSLVSSRTLLPSMKRWIRSRRRNALDLIVDDIQDPAELADPIDLDIRPPFEGQTAVADEVRETAFNDRLNAVIIVNPAVAKNDPGAKGVDFACVKHRPIRPVCEAAFRQFQHKWGQNRRKAR